MTEALRPAGLWARLPVVVRSVVAGIVIGLAAANVWPLLLFNLGMPLAAAAEGLFLTAFLWWAGGGGPPRALKTVRAQSYRLGTLSGAQWIWGLIAAVFFAVTVHAAIVVLFRLVTFPAVAFHAGYDLSFIPTLPMRWLAVVVSAASAGICEEVGFRGYMQRPIENRYGAAVAILISSAFFTLLHLNKDWSTVGMAPIVFGAGLLLGTLARASGTLVFCMIGHTVMDIGLFAYWWTQMAGTFSQSPISQTGMDQAFYVEGGVLGTALLMTLAAIVKLRRLRDRS